MKYAFPGPQRLRTLLLLYTCYDKDRFFVTRVTLASAGLSCCVESSTGLSLWQIISIVFGCLGVLVIGTIVYIVTRHRFRSPSVPPNDDVTRSRDKRFPLTPEVGDKLRRPRPGALRWTPAVLAFPGGLRQRTSAGTPNNVPYFREEVPRRRTFRSKPSVWDWIP